MTLTPSAAFGPGEAEVLKVFEFMILRSSSLKILGLCHSLTAAGWSESEALGAGRKREGLGSSTGHSPGHLTSHSASLWSLQHS